jgi:hypothetical protein
MRAHLGTLLAGTVALGGCAYGGYGPYGGMSVGVGYDSGYGYGGYGGGGYPYGAYGGYSDPYYGWYDNYYYPGTGYYVYDSYRRPRVWTSTQRSYWTSRQPVVTTSGTTRTRVVTQRQNWSGFNRGSTIRAQRQAMRQDRRRSQ